MPRLSRCASDGGERRERVAAQVGGPVATLRYYTISPARLLGKHREEGRGKLFSPVPVYHPATPERLTPEPPSADCQRN
jgi:hypothetical protein